MHFKNNISLNSRILNTGIINLTIFKGLTIVYVWKQHFDTEILKYSLFCMHGTKAYIARISPQAKKLLLAQLGKFLKNSHNMKILFQSV